MHHTIEVEDLKYSYPDGHQALCGVDLIIAPGEKAALVGPNGSGKTTLMLHLNGILQGEGSVKVCGQSICDKTMGFVRASVGLVFQDPDDQLFSPTVLEDVAYGPMYMGLSANEVKDRVANALDSVGLVGYEDRVSHHLSGGEKKQVSIATVLAMDPEILVLDEPTAGLDPRGRRRLINLLHELPQTMLVASHDVPMVAELFTRTIVIDGGVIVRDGSTREILQDSHFLEEHGLESAVPW
ncbi:MAG: ATP-binding cassette domain-containing protein [Anaerolineales bacterium]|nr:ATP-binding cassette domain-containing protein [Anaerolineales bacterium]